MSSQNKMSAASMVTHLLRLLHGTPSELPCDAGNPQLDPGDVHLFPARLKSQGHVEAKAYKPWTAILHFFHSINKNIFNLGAINPL